jgi:hypothetical protein
MTNSIAWVIVGLIAVGSLLCAFILLQSPRVAARVNTTVQAVRYGVRGCLFVLLTLVAGLAVIYGLVRFVHWAWYD